MNNKELSIEQINQPDASTFRVLYKEYYRALVAYAVQMVESVDAAEDIVQELFSSLWEKPKSFPSLTALRSYLYCAVRNASLDYLKHKNIENDYLQRLADNYQEYRMGKSDDESFFDEEVYRLLFRTIDALPERCREVFLLAMQGKKNEEIAETLRVSQETVKTQKKRGMAFLKKNMAQSPLLSLFLAI